MIRVLVAHLASIALFASLPACSSAAQAPSWSPVCPPTMPALGSACTGNAECEYDPAPSIGCATNVTCQGGQWSWNRSVPSRCVPSPPPNPAACPAQFARPDVAACTQIDLECSYDPLHFCQCEFESPEEASMGVEWKCPALDGLDDPACPAQRPRIGAPCDLPLMSCTYDDACGAPEVCLDGVWRLGGSGC